MRKSVQIETCLSVNQSHSRNRLCTYSRSLTLPVQQTTQERGPLTQFWELLWPCDDMQNRSNRSLLFGGRADASNSGASVGAGAPTAMELDAMEADNQAGVEGLRAPAARMKDVRFWQGKLRRMLLLTCMPDCDAYWTRCKWPESNVRPYGTWYSRSLPMIPANISVRTNDSMVPQRLWPTHSIALLRWPTSAGCVEWDCLSLGSSSCSSPYRVSWSDSVLAYQRWNIEKCCSRLLKLYLHSWNIAVR